MLRRTLLACLLAALASPAAAGARVVVIASGDANATLADVSTNRVVNRVAVGGVARAVAVAPDGSRAFVAAGNQIVSVDLGAQAVTASVTLGGLVGGLAISADGARLYASRPAALDVLDTATLHGAGTV